MNTENRSENVLIWTRQEGDGKTFSWRSAERIDVIETIDIDTNTARSTSMAKNGHAIDYGTNQVAFIECGQSGQVLAKLICDALNAKVIK